MSTAIQHYDGMGSQITQFRDPEDVLAEAQKAAAALVKVVSMKKDPVKFNGEIYLEREDWGTVARFYNCTAKPTETRYVEYGNVHGFEATAVVIDMRTGLEVGRAESMCLDDEDNWGSVPKYEWKDKLDENGKKIWNPKGGREGKGSYERDKVLVGETKKPLFQLKSMAQTRAEAKALKGVFSWVVVLAGYKPTPAEEMTGNEFEGHEEPQPKKEPIPTPQSNKAQPLKSVDVSGIIEGVQAAASGKVYLTLKNVTPALVSVSPEKFDKEGMKPGNFIKFHAFGLQNEKLGGKFWDLVSVHELSQVQEGEAPAKEQTKMAEDAAQVAKEMFPDNPSVQGMVDSGALKPASQIETKKTIGSKRAQRLYAIANQNKDKNDGFNEKAIKELLAVLPVPLEHLSDLESGMYAQFEKWAEGTESWKAWLDSD